MSKSNVVIKIKSNRPDIGPLFRSYLSKRKSSSAYGYGDYWGLGNMFGWDGYDDYDDDDSDIAAYYDSLGYDWEDIKSKRSKERDSVSTVHTYDEEDDDDDIYDYHHNEADDFDAWNEYLSNHPNANFDDWADGYYTEIAEESMKGKKSSNKTANGNRKRHRHHRKNGGKRVSPVYVENYDDDNNDNSEDMSFDDVVKSSSKNGGKLSGSEVDGLVNADKTITFYENPKLPMVTRKFSSFKKFYNFILDRGEDLDDSTTAKLLRLTVSHCCFNPLKPHELVVEHSYGSMYWEAVDEDDDDNYGMSSFDKAEEAIFSEHPSES